MSVGPKPQCPWRKPPKHHFDRADRLANVVIGGLFGMLISLPLSIQLWLTLVMSEHDGLSIPFALIGVAMAVCATLGALPGDRFVNWMSDNWGLFVRHSIHSDSG